MTTNGDDRERDKLSPSNGAATSGRATQREVAVSVVIEWENMTYAEQSRPRQAIAALKAQAEVLTAKRPTGAPDERSATLKDPLDVILSYNADVVSKAEPLSGVSDLLIDSEAIRFRFLAVEEGTYCRQKNAGAEAAKGEIVIFLDSDNTPEPTWLTAYLQAFADPAVQVVVGNTYVDTSRGDVYSRSMALTWMFPLRDAVGGLKPSTWFYANNIAFRRKTALAHPFPHTPGLKHHAARLLVDDLERSGIVLWYHGDARAYHPPPNGVGHFVSRAIAAGRARVLAQQSPGPFAPLVWIRDEASQIGWLCRRIVREGSRVDMQWWQVPAAMGVTVAYYGLRLGGSLATYFAPGLMQDKFDL